jgi:hypothetical protein
MTAVMTALPASRLRIDEGGLAGTISQLAWMQHDWPCEPKRVRGPWTLFFISSTIHIHLTAKTSKVLIFSMRCF